MKPVERPTTAFILAAVGVALGAWQFGFNWGVYATVFFEHIFTVWIASLAVCLACLWLPAEQRPLSVAGMLALTTPTLWLVVAVLAHVIETDLSWLLFVVGNLVLLLCLPYVAYVLIALLQTDGTRLRGKRALVGLVSIAVGIAALGYVVGANHFYVLTCNDFRLSGQYIPKNCWPLPESWQ